MSDNDDLDKLAAEFADAAEEAPKPKAAPKKRAAPKKKTSVAAKGNTKKIILESHDDIPPTGLYVGHNGRGYLIKVDVEVDVPLHILEILDNAKQAMPIIDPDTQQVVAWRERSRYNYRVVG